LPVCLSLSNHYPQPSIQSAIERTQHAVMKHTVALLAAVAITIALQSAADCQQRSPAAAQSEIDMAEKAVAAKDYIGAAEHLDKARQRTPFSPGILFNQAVAEARAGGRRALGAQGVGRLRDEDVGEDVGQMTHRCHQPVVRLGVDRLRAGAEPGDRPLQAVVEAADRES